MRIVFVRPAEGTDLDSDGRQRHRLASSYVSATRPPVSFRRVQAVRRLSPQRRTARTHSRAIARSVRGGVLAVSRAGLPDLAEGERVGLDPGVGEGDLEGAVGDGAGLPDELVQPLFGHRSVALAVHVGPVRRTRRLAVDEHAEPHRRALYGGPHDQVQIAGVEAVGDLPAGLVGRGGVFAHRPGPGQGPVIESQLRRGLIGVTLARYRAAGGGEVLGALVAGVVLW